MNFKIGDIIVTKSNGSLRAEVTFVTKERYYLKFDFDPEDSHKPGRIEVFNRDYMLESVRNSPLYQALK